MAIKSREILVVIVDSGINYLHVSPSNQILLKNLIKPKCKGKIYFNFDFREMKLKELSVGFRSPYSISIMNCILSAYPSTPHPIRNRASRL